MKQFFSILIILIAARQSFALKCIACEASDSEEACDFSDKCAKGTKYCETLVSKVDGSYSVIMSCATEEKCEANPILEGGLRECKHSKTDTECYSCCKGNNCNTFEAALEELPEDFFEAEESSKKVKKSKGKKEVNEDEEEDETDEETEENGEEEEEVEKEDKNSKIKDKNSKTKNESEDVKPKDTEESDEEYSEEETNDEEFSVDGKAVVEDSKAEATNVTVANTTAETTNDTPANNAAVEATNGIATNNTAEATKANSTVENSTDNLNVQEIDKKLNETVTAVKSLFENNENVENTDLDFAFGNGDSENTEYNITGMEEKKVEEGVVFDAPGDSEEESEEILSTENSDGESSIITEGENADEMGEHNELFDTGSSSTSYKVSEVLLFLSSIIILIRLF